MFVNCRFSTSDRKINISPRVSDLEMILNIKGYAICAKAFEGTDYRNKVVGDLSIMESDTLASIAIIFMQDTSILCDEDEPKYSSLFSAIMEISARNKHAFTVCVEVELDDIGSLVCLCREIVKNSPFLDRVRVIADPEDLDSVKEFGGVEIIYRQEEEK